MIVVEHSEGGKALALLPSFFVRKNIIKIIKNSGKIGIRLDNY